MNKDTRTFLGYLMKRGEEAPRQSDFAKITHSLHLAFKQHSADDIYDVLVLCLLRAVRRYDPHYTDRIKHVVEVINEEFPEQVLTAAYVSGRVGFNSFGCLRLLARHGFLAMVKDENEKVVEYQRAAWPPPAKFFQAGAIGFTYFAQKCLTPKCFIMRDFNCAPVAPVAPVSMPVEHEPVVGSPALWKFPRSLHNASPLRGLRKS